MTLVSCLQGAGIILAAIASVILLMAYGRTAGTSDREVAGIWRTVVGIGAAPCLLAGVLG
jgi:hypothetical protein